MEDQKTLLDSRLVKLSSNLSMQSKPTPLRNNVSSVCEDFQQSFRKKKNNFKNKNIRNACD